MKEFEKTNLIDFEKSGYELVARLPYKVRGVEYGAVLLPLVGEYKRGKLSDQLYLQSHIFAV